MEYQDIVTNVKKGVIETPAYIFDIDILRRKVAMIREVLGREAKMCYAIKANPFLLAPMDDMVDKYEVCSPGELEICRNSQIAMSKVVFSGINKTAASVRTASDYGVGVMTVESMHQFDLIADCAASTRRTINVVLRLTNGSQFGINESDIEQLIARRELHPYVHILGVQYFTGTQKKKVAHILEELDYATAFCAHLEETYHYHMEQFEYGTGLWVPYFTGDSFDNEFSDLACIHDYLVKKALPWQVILEMGRYPVASCGYFATRAEDCKTNKDANYCIIDAGIHHINYYGQNMALKTPIIDHYPMHRMTDEAPKTWMLCGSLCTFNDVVARNLPVQDLRIGDYFIFHNIGAYAVTEGGYLFLSRDLPNIYFADAKNGIRLVRKGIPSHILNTPDFSGRRLDSPEAPVFTDSVFSDSVFDEPHAADVFSASAPAEKKAAPKTCVIPSPAVLHEQEKDSQAPRISAPNRPADDDLDVIPMNRQTAPQPTVSRPAPRTPKRFVPETDVLNENRRIRENAERNASPVSGAKSASRADASRRTAHDVSANNSRPDTGRQMHGHGSTSERSVRSGRSASVGRTADAAGERSSRPSDGARRSSQKRKKGNKRPIIIGILAVLLVVGLTAGIYFGRRVRSSVNVEAGGSVTTADLLRYSGDQKKNNTTLNINTSVPGDYPVTVHLAPFTYHATVHVKDTAAPVATVKAITTKNGVSCAPEDFIVEITDASRVTVAFAAEPDFTVTGDQEVRLLLTDSAGNQSTVTATLTVGEPLPFDEEAPTVYADDIHVIVGGTVAYKKAIRAYDNVDTAEQLTITADNSQVDLNTVGDYPYTATVTDRNGNAGTAAATVHVLEADAEVADIDEVNRLADEILSEIITDDMGGKDKLRAIYKWVRANTSYSGHAQEEDYTLGAYQGFTEHTGDCFTYAAQAKFLLTRAGIENIDVVKVVPEGSTDIPTHFWNLVNIGEGWYHLDCTPRKDGSTFFYLTDAELAEYSDSHNGTHKFDHSLYPEIE